MSMNPGIRETAYRAMLISLLATLVACGGDKKDDDPCTNPTHFSQAIICELGKNLRGGAGPEAPTTGYDADTPGQLVATIGGDGQSAEIAIFDEYESNDSLNNANVVTIPGATSDTRTGVKIIGQLQGDDDPSDYYIFTPYRSGTYSVFLCADSCAETRKDDGVLLMIYDQSQTTIASTPLGNIVVQELAADLASGLAYYIEVQSYKKGPDTYDYRLVIVD